MKRIVTLPKIFLLFVLCASIITAHAQRGYSRHYYDSWRYYPSRGQVFVRMPGPFISLQFGGNPYYYSGGLFYRPYGSYFSVVVPPIGIHIGSLPRGYWPLRWGGYPYYYYNGIFYRQGVRDYEVVQAPVGAEVPAIPRDAQTVVIDGAKYYEYNGTYFRETIKPNGEIWYTVEGKHGVLNTDRANEPAAGNTQATPAPERINKQPVIGDVLDQLPAGCKTVVINSRKYFVTTDNVYYEEVVEGNTVKYRVAGK
jgi:hypothetical protein